MILTNNDARLNSGRRTDPSLERARRPDEFIESYRRCHSRLVPIFHRSAKGVLYTHTQEGNRGGGGGGGGGGGKTLDRR